MEAEGEGAKVRYTREGLKLEKGDSLCLFAASSKSEQTSLIAEDRLEWGGRGGGERERERRISVSTSATEMA